MTLRRNYGDDGDAIVPVRRTRREAKRQDHDDRYYLQKGIDVLELKHREPKKDVERRRFPVKTAGSNQLERHARDLHAGEPEEVLHQQRDNREREATVTVYAYPAVAARLRQQPVAQQWVQEDTLNTSDGSNISIRRSVRRKSR